MINEVCKFNKLLLESNLVTWTSGNVSGADSKGYLYIKPSGVLFPDLEPEDISIVSIDYGTHIEGKKPSTDTDSHRIIYKNKPEIKSIVHTHSTFATAFAACGKNIPVYLTAMADEFDAIFEKQKDNEGSELASGVSYDFNEDFIKFTEKWFPAYDGMTKQQKDFFTYKFLSGTKHINQRGNKTKKFQTRKLLPFKFLDKDIMRTYAKKFWQYLKVPYSQKRDYQSSKGMKKWGWNRFTDAFRVGRKENNIPRLCG